MIYQFIFLTSFQVFGKAEGPKGMSETNAKKLKKWHGHVTAVTIPPDYRRLGLASRLMDVLELVTEEQ